MATATLTNERVEIAGQDKLFPVLSQEQVECLIPYSAEVILEPGDVLFKEGEPADRFYVLLDGEIKVTRQVAGGEVVLAVHDAGHFTGEISLLTGGTSIATGRATKTTRLIGMDPNGLRRVIAMCPWLAEIILTAMVARRPEADVMVAQREKLASLGGMAAGLAHELNNPASAALRGAAQLKEVMRQQPSLLCALARHKLTADQLENLDAMPRVARERQANEPPLDSLALSDREDELTEWLEEVNVADAWKVAATFAATGITREQLEEYAAEVPEEALCDALNWLESSVTIENLLSEVEQSAQRISRLVQAVKEYSYMDQAPIQEVNVVDGLENTLLILAHKLRKTSIRVHKDYDTSCPPITAFGSELAQVWTNIIVNAIEAMEGKGNLWVRTCCEADTILVEIGDDGPGIPPEIQKRIFEPFFTTKGVGKGTGLGLSVSHKIITARHGGDLRVISEPGKGTTFQARLPIGGVPQNVNCEM